MFKILIFLGCCIIVSGTSFSQSKQKRSLFGGDVRIVSPLSSPSYGYSQPWSRSRNPWKSLKISSDLYESSPGLSYGSARPPPPSPTVIVTKHVIVEKPVPVPGQPIIVEKQVHVPVPVEKIVPQIIPYPVERQAPIRQIGIPVPIFIAPQGLLGGSGSVGASPVPTPSPPAPPPPPPPINPLPRQYPNVVQHQQIQPQTSGSSQPISLSVSAGLSGIPFQIPVQMLQSNQMPVQMLQSSQVPLQVVQNNQIPVQLLPSSHITPGLFQGLDPSSAQVSTFETVPDSVQGNNLGGYEAILLDDWKLD